MPDDDLRRELDDWLDVEVPTREWTDADGDPAHQADLAPPIAPAPDETFADRLLYKVRKLDEERASIERIAAERRADIDSWAEDRTHGIENERRRVEASLSMFMQQWHLAHPRSKQLKLPNGTLKLTAPGGRIDVTDKEALIAFAESTGRSDLLDYKPQPIAKALAELAHGPEEVGIVSNARGTTELATVSSLLVPGPGADEPVPLPGVRFVKPTGDRFAMVPKSDTRSTPTTEPEEAQ